MVDYLDFWYFFVYETKNILCCFGGVRNGVFSSI